MEKLSAKMQERLDKWRKRSTPEASVEKPAQKVGNYRRQREFGDDYERELEMHKHRTRS